MRILYGIQATGNGHITRSREVVRLLKERGHDVRVVVSGREKDRIWGMEDLEPYDVFRGMTFVTRGGKVRPLRTAAQLKPVRFYRDIAELDASRLDLVICDFEPVSARVARRNGIPSIGVGHQYAFASDVPIAAGNPVARIVLKRFAPVDHPVGLHWYHFDQPAVLPPILPASILALRRVRAESDKIVVYLPFEEIEAVELLVKPFKSRRFFIYCGLANPQDRDNVHLRPFSRTGFLDDLATCSGVICNAGFELPSEALYLGKKLLLKPLAGQLEQRSNALALDRLGLGAVMKALDGRAVSLWLDQPSNPPLPYPDVAAAVAAWIDAGRWADTASLARAVWAKTNISFTKVPAFKGAPAEGRA